MKLFRTALLVAVALGVTALAPPAAAQSPGGSGARRAATKNAAEADKAKAKIHFQAGAAYYRESRYEEAIRSFHDAYRFDANPNLLFNIAQAHEKLGQTSEALQFYRRYVRENPDAPDRRTVVMSIRNLESRLAEQGLQQVQVYSTPAGAIASIDGRELGPTPVSENLRPGRHRLSVRLDGHKTVERDFGLSPGRALDIDVVLESGVGVVEAEPIGELPFLLPPEEEPLQADLTGEELPLEPIAGSLPEGALTPVEAAPQPGFFSRIRPGTWTAFGVAAAAGVVGGVLQMSKASIEARAANEPVQLEYLSLSQQAQARATGSRIAFGIGGAAAAVGSTLMMIDLGLLFSEKE